MSLSASIKALLYQYDCVIVPGFGAFICNFSPAKIHPVQHKFYPPAKQISFNQMLQVNDGLLAHFIAQKNQIAYPEALQMIADEVVGSMKNLNRGEQVDLQDIGSFYNDQRGIIQFNPSNEINYLTDSFGLTIFQSLPIDRDKKLKVVHKAEPIKELTAPKEINWTAMAKYSAAAAIVSIIGLTTFKMNFIENLQNSQINLNPFKMEKAVYSTRTYEDFSPAVTENKSNLKELIDQTDAQFMDYELNGKKLTVKLHEKIVEERSHAAVKQSGPYHIVGGCFGVKNNAIKLTKKLNKQGYPAHIATTLRGLYVVSYQSFSDQNEARQFLEEVKRDANPQAWLLKK